MDNSDKRNRIIEIEHIGFYKVSENPKNYLSVTIPVKAQKKLGLKVGDSLSVDIIVEQNRIIYTKKKKS